MKTKGNSLRYITVTAVFSAVAAVLMMLSFNVPLMPSFIKFDFSELPVLIGQDAAIDKVVRAIQRHHGRRRRAFKFHFELYFCRYGGNDI